MMRIRINKKCFEAIVVAGIAAILTTGCGNSNSTPSAPGTNRPGNVASNDNRPLEISAAWVNIPSLANKTPEEVENAVGKHTNIVPVKEPPQEVPGENRTYNLPDMKEALSVRFYKGKAVAFTVTVPKGRELKTSGELGKMTGFDVAGKEPVKGTEFMSQWNGQFGPAAFAEVTIGKTPATGYNLVRARTRE